MSCHDHCTLPPGTSATRSRLHPGTRQSYKEPLATQCNPQFPVDQCRPQQCYNLQCQRKRRFAVASSENFKLCLPFSTRGRDAQEARTCKQKEIMGLGNTKNKSRSTGEHSVPKFTSFVRVRRENEFLPAEAVVADGGSSCIQWSIIFAVHVGI